MICLMLRQTVKFGNYLDVLPMLYVGVYMLNYHPMIRFGNVKYFKQNCIEYAFRKQNIVTSLLR